MPRFYCLWESNKLSSLISLTVSFECIDILCMFRSFNNTLHFYVVVAYDTDSFLQRTTVLVFQVDTVSTTLKRIPDGGRRSRRSSYLVECECILHIFRWEMGFDPPPGGNEGKTYEKVKFKSRKTSMPRRHRQTLSWLWIDVRKNSVAFPVSSRPRLSLSPTLTDLLSQIEYTNSLIISDTRDPFISLYFFNLSVLILPSFDDLSVNRPKL